MLLETCRNGTPGVAADRKWVAVSQFLATIEQIRAIAAEREDPAVLEGCAELDAKLHGHELNVVVVGQFKRGKTSFINSLIGEPLLPVAVLPLTSIVTVLRYGDEPGATVHFQSGEIRQLALAELGEFVTEAGNPDNRREVSRVEVSYPSDYLHSGVRLIDTPGIGSVYAHNSKVTYDFVSRIDAAVFVTSPDPPLMPAELELLSDIIAQVPKVFLVLNKIDLLDRQQLHDVLNFVRQNLPKAACDLPVLPVSAYLAGQARRDGNDDVRQRSGFPRFEEELRRFLREDGETVFLHAVNRRLESLIADLELRLKLEVEAILTPVQELRERVRALNEELDSARRQEIESQLLMEGHLGELREQIRQVAADFAHEQAEPIRIQLNRQLDEPLTVPRQRLASEMDNRLRREIESRFDSWMAHAEKTALTELSEVTGRFRTAINDLIHRVCQTTGTLFGIELGGLQADVELAIVRSEGYHTDPLLTWGLGRFPLLLPGPLYRRYLRKELFRRVPEELERNANRRAYDLCRRLDHGAALFQRAMKEKLEQTMRRIREAIDSALTLQAEGEEPARKAADRLRRVLHTLDQLKSNRMLEKPPAKGSLP
jgi:ribosome biogenesis GTPase A